MVTDLPVVCNIPDANLAVVTASDDMLHVRGHQYGGDTVCGCMAPPQHHRNHYTAAACHPHDLRDLHCLPLSQPPGFVGSST